MIQKNANKEEFYASMSRVRLLAMDIDGILTDGGLYYSDSGEELRKFNVKDGQGIKLVMSIGVEVALISAAFSQAAIHRANRLGITYVFTSVEDKLSVLKELCANLAISLDQVAYMGDDINDLPILAEVGCPLTVADAIPANKEFSIYVTTLPGGQGAVREICDYLVKIKSGNLIA